MSHQVPWNKIILEEFIEQACLTKDEEFVMRTRVAGWTRVEQSMKLGISMSALDKMINKLKIKYDKIERTNPLLPPRKFSAQETWQDEN